MSKSYSQLIYVFDRGTADMLISEYSADEIQQEQEIVIGGRKAIVLALNRTLKEEDLTLNHQRNILFDNKQFFWLARRC